MDFTRLIYEVQIRFSSLLIGQQYYYTMSKVYRQLQIILFMFL